MILNRDKKLLYLKIFYPTWKILRSEEPWTSEFGLGQHVLKHLVWLTQLSKTRSITHGGWQYIFCIVIKF